MEKRDPSPPAVKEPTNNESAVEETVNTEEEQPEEEPAVEAMETEETESTEEEAVAVAEAVVEGEEPSSSVVEEEKEESGEVVNPNEKGAAPEDTSVDDKKEEAGASPTESAENDKDDDDDDDAMEVEEGQDDKVEAAATEQDPTPEEEEETPPAQQQPEEEEEPQPTASEEETAPAEETVAPQQQNEVIYSTRGRSADTDPLDRLVREALSGGGLGGRSSSIAGAAAAEEGMGGSGGTAPGGPYSQSGGVGATATTTGGSHLTGSVGGGGSGAPVMAPESFLSDSLTEEERRTRTRYIPVVTGMHALRKSQVKADLALARQALGSTAVGTASLARTTNKRGTSGGTTKQQRQPHELPDNASSNSNSDNDAAMGAAGAAGSVPGGGGANNSATAAATTMDIDDAAGVLAAPSEDERMSDILRLGGASRLLQIGSNELALPSTAFVAPAAEQMGDKSTTTAGTGGATTTKRSPRQVEAVTAFNPPRPPESVGAKKKHRMLRWERRPADIEIDLQNYRKTVLRTQEELRNAQQEQERTETVENLLRTHFLHHMANMDQEMLQLNQELLSVQQQCIAAADLANNNMSSSSRTRSTRAAAAGNKGNTNTNLSAAMRDVMNVLRSHGAEIQAKGLVLDNKTNHSDDNKKMNPVKGMGGVGTISFQDWNDQTVLQPQKPAIADAWIVPGDEVQTPYGKGSVVAVFPASPLNVKEDLPRALQQRGQQQAANNNKDAMMTDTTTAAATTEQQQQAAAADASSANKAAQLGNVLAPRVAVRLPFGVGYFGLHVLSGNYEDPTTYTDERLATRWKGLLETAQAVSSTLDLEAMATTMTTTEPGGGSGVGNKRRLLPFGAEMLPSARGRGSLLVQASLEDLDRALDTPLYDGGGVVGIRDNCSLPRPFVQMELQREEELTLTARALQLRNKLYRQRRIRMLNERTLAATQERATRVESIVSEMRSDLKSLKTRLDEEVRELGVSEQEAEEILSLFYKSLDSSSSPLEDDAAAAAAGEPSPPPPKRPRRQSAAAANVDEEGGGGDEDLQPPAASLMEVDPSTADSGNNAAVAMET